MSSCSGVSSPCDTQDSYSQAEYKDTVEDDLTDLEGSDNETSCDLSICPSADTLTLVQKDHVQLRGENPPAPFNYRGNELVVEIEKRRERDFGGAKSSTASEQRRYRSTLPLVKKPSTTEQKKSEIFSPPKPPLVEHVWSLTQPHPPTLTTGEQTAASHCGPAPSSPLTPSLFPNHLPPTIHFPLHNEPCELVHTH